MLNLIFFGSDQYSAIVLSTLLTTDLRIHGYTDIRVITDQHQDPSPVEKLAITHNLKVLYYPSNLAEMNIFIKHLKSSILSLKSTESPIGLCASFDHLVPASIIDLFAGQLYNLHPSLLPQYRNVSPVQYALALGDKVTGITLFRITTGIDNGEIISQVSEPILEGDTTPTLTSRLFAKGAELFLGFLGSDLKGSAQPADSKAGRSDPAGTLIFTKRLTRQSGYIEWSVLHKLLANQPVDPSDTENDLLLLRLSQRTLLKRNSWLQAKKGSTADERRVLAGTQILHDLIRALSPWPSVWTTIPTKKGELRVTLESVSPDITLKIAGKPKAITYSDFTKYYF